MFNGRKAKPAPGKGRRRVGRIAALDVGSTKVCCFIAEAATAGAIKVGGIGHQRAKGVRHGTIVNLDEAEATIRTAVAAAEKMVDAPIDEVYVNLSAGQPESHTLAVEVSIAGHEIADPDLRRILDQGRAQFETEGRAMVHSFPLGFAIDGANGIRDPRGMSGARLGVDIHVVTATSSAIRNLSTCVARCHLGVAAHVLSSVASGLASLVEDEMALGATVIDMGGGTTSIAVFLDGYVVHTDCLTVGGMHVTKDIARGLSTTLAHAERMKTLYGATMASPSDDHEIVAVPLVGEEEEHNVTQVPRSMLVGIIRPRLEETFEMVRARLADSGMSRAAGRRVVLTGGASQLQGVRELAALILDKQVRVGRPLRTAGLAEATAGPAFATCAGLLAYAAASDLEARDFARPLQTPAAGCLGRVGQWLRENF
ncbi:MAG: cell division protein FtsA [Proteobacteria bacterium]|nr:cell division protein FtsA [Pseudomonadota bacterium]